MAMTARHVGAGGAFPLRASLQADGRIVVTTGVTDQGAGAATVIQRVLAAALAMDPGDVAVIRVPTDGADPDRGVGSSRVTHLVSRSALELAAEVRAWLVERTPPDTAITDTRAAIAAAVRPGQAVEVRGSYDSELAADAHGHHDFAACAIEISVDRATGQVTVHDALLVVDVGTVINPVAHRGQLEGGFAFGFGAATMEELVVEDGVVTTTNLDRLKLPSARDVPSVRIVLLHTDIGPGAFGAKMAGELTNTVVAPALANAVFDALGVRLTRLPITAEAIHEASREAGSLV
jgi:CO/xanthine dehydrogenase Mo-binding subunit